MDSLPIPGPSKDEASADEASADGAPNDKVSTDEASADGAPNDKVSTDEAPNDKVSADEASADEASADEASKGEPTASLPSSTARSSLTAGVIMLALAAVLLLCGLGSLVFYIVLPFSAQDVSEAIQTNVICGSTAGLGLLFGLVLFWQGLNGARGKAATPAARAFPPLVVLALVYAGAIVLGVAALAVQPVAAFIFPPWHFLAALIPPVGLVAYAAHRLGTSSGLRALLVSFGWGAFVATTLAFVLEIVVAGVFVLIAVLILLSLPNSQTLLDQIRAQFLLARRTQDFSALAPWLSNPAVIAAVVLYVAGVVPPIEEAVKALVVAFINPQQTRARDALLWGMAAGAGFAVVENMLNASVDLAAWAPLVLLRIGASIVHVTNGANIGLGWYAARVERRWGRLVSAYVISILYHAVWNGTAILLSGVGIGVAPGAASTILMGALLLILILLAALGLTWTIYRIHEPTN
jgi:hypothetical protein